MKRFLLLTVVLFLVSALAVTSVLAARDPFIGAWKSTDTDGSYQTLTIGGGPGNRHSVRYYDFGATVCGLDLDTGDFLFAASARGFLYASDGSLTGNMPVYCQEHPPTFYGDFDFSYRYDAEYDTLLDPNGITWTRR